MDSILILGGIYAFCDIVSDIHDYGYRAIVCDYYADSPAKKIADISYDVSTLDVDAIVAIAKENNVKGIVCVFSDRNLKPGYQAAQQLNLPVFYGPAQFDIFTDKINMKAWFQKNNIPVLPYKIVTVDEAANVEIPLPVVIKPVDAYGSKGVFLCNSKDEILMRVKDAVAASAGYDDCLIVERCWSGGEISASAWISGEEVYVTCIYDIIRRKQNGTSLSYVRFPSVYTERWLDTITEYIRQIAHASGITEGPVTLQCFLDDDEIYVSEFLCRLAGGSPYMYPEYFNGPNLFLLYLDYITGNPVNLRNLPNFLPKCESMFYDLLIQIERPGKIHYEIEGGDIFKALPNCVDFRMYHKEAEQVVSVPPSGKVVARVIIKKPDIVDINQLSREISSALKITDENGDNIMCLNF